MRPTPEEVEAAKDRCADQVTSILEQIGDERMSQCEKWGEQNHPIEEQVVGVASRREKEDQARKKCEMRARLGHLSWVDILQEELQEVNGAEDDAHARTELIQLAAVAVAAIECIDRRAARAAPTHPTPNPDGLEGGL